MILSLHPSSQGVYTEWSNTLGSAVTDVGTADGTNVIHTAQIDAIHEFQLPATPITNPNDNMVMAVKMVARAKSTSAGDTLRLTLRRGITSADRWSKIPRNSEFTLTTSFADYYVIFSNLPFVNIHSRDDAWNSDGSDFDDYALGVMAGAICAGTISVDEIRFDVIYRPKITLDEILEDERALTFQWLEIEGIRWVPSDRTQLHPEEWSVGSYYHGFDYRPVPGCLLSSQNHRSGTIDLQTGREEYESAQATLIDIDQFAYEGDANGGDPDLIITEQGFWSYLFAYGDETNMGRTRLKDSTGAGYNSIKGLDPKDWSGDNYGRKLAIDLAGGFEPPGGEDSYLYIGKETIWYGDGDYDWNWSTQSVERDWTILECQALVDTFFYDTAIDGDYCALSNVSDPEGGSDAGAVYVFHYEFGEWRLQQKILGGGADYFIGNALSLSGDTLAVGAVEYPGDETGAVFVYRRSGSTWSLEQIIEASDKTVGDQFGWDLSLDGDTLIVGAPSRGVGTTGGVYVYTRSGTTWSERTILVASDTGNPSEFGASLALDATNGRCIIGAGIAGSGTHQGQAYIFTGSGASWSEEKKLTASDADDYYYYGQDVDIDGDYAIVGAHMGTGIGAGKAYIYIRDGGAWSEQVIISGEALNDDFGGGVSIEGDVVVIMANDEASKYPHAGAAYVYSRNGTNWYLQKKYTIPYNQIGPYYYPGQTGLYGSVRLSGSKIMFPAYQADGFNVYPIGMIIDAPSYSTFGDETDTNDLLRGRFGSMNEVHEYNLLTGVYPEVTSLPVCWANRWVRRWLNAIDPLTGYPFPRSVAIARSYIWESVEQILGSGKNQWVIQLSPFENILKRTIVPNYVARAARLTFRQYAFAPSVIDSTGDQIISDATIYEHSFEDINDLLFDDTDGINARLVDAAANHFTGISYSGRCFINGDRVQFNFRADSRYCGLTGIIEDSESCVAMGLKSYIDYPDNKSDLSDPPGDDEDQIITGEEAPATVFISAFANKIYIQDGDGDNWPDLQVAVSPNDDIILLIAESGDEKKFFVPMLADIDTDSNGDYFTVSSSADSKWNALSKKLTRNHIFSRDGKGITVKPGLATNEVMAHRFYLRAILSTGFGTNNTIYDVWPRGFGIGINEELIDVESFEDVSHALKMVRSYAIFNPTPLLDLLEEELKFPYGLVLRQNESGQISLKLNLIPIDSDDVPVILNEHWTRAPISQRHHIRNVINRYIAKIDYDPITEKFGTVLDAKEPNSIDKYGEKSVQIEHHGIHSDVMGEKISTEGSAHSIYPNLCQIQFYRHAWESPILKGQLTQRGLGLTPGGGLIVTQNDIADPWNSSATGITSRPCGVLRIEKDDVKGLCDVELVYDYKPTRFTSYAPAAVIQTWVSAQNSATIYGHRFSKNTENGDVYHFAADYEVVMVQGNLNVANVEHLSVLNVDLTTSQIWFNSAPSNFTPGDGDFVIWQNYDKLTSNQKGLYYAHVESSNFIDSTNSVPGWDYGI